MALEIAESQRVAERASRPLFQNILYATDFSRQSGAVAPFVQALARQYGSKVFLTHVISLMPFAKYSPTQAWQELAAQAVRESWEKMEAMEPQWKGISHETLVLKGDIWRELSRITENKKIDLIVAGTHGYSGVSKLVVGSVAEQIFRHAPCPVLTVGPGVSGEPRSVVDIHTILCPADLAPASQPAVDAAIALTDQHRARLYLLHVTPDPIDDASEALLTEKLRRLIPPGKALWCEPKFFVESGVAADRILAVAEELAVDLIVMGPKRFPLIPGAHLTTSTAYGVIRRANCPVLTAQR
jgi:nucleotide-binding universal stress UspA family protein